MQTAKQFVKRTQPGKLGAVMPLAKQLAAEMVGASWEVRARAADDLAWDLVGDALGSDGLADLMNGRACFFVSAHGISLAEQLAQLVAGYRTVLTAALLLLEEQQRERWEGVPSGEQALILSMSGYKPHVALAHRWLDEQADNAKVAAILRRLNGLALIFKADHFGKDTLEASLSHDAIQAAVHALVINGGRPH